MGLLHSVQVEGGFPKHFHETFTVGVVNAGVVANVVRGGTEYLPRGHLYVYNPGEVHSGAPAFGVPAERYSFYPPEAAFGGLARALGSAGSPSFTRSVINDAGLADRLRHLYQVSVTSPYLLERQSLTLEVMGALLVRYAETRARPPGGREPAAVELVRAYLHAHFAENVSLGDLAAAARLERSYLIRAFRKQVGVPPYTYLLNCRVERARTLLAKGLPPTEAALEVGFSDQSHLNRFFRRFVGTTPAAYRRGQH